MSDRPSNKPKIDLVDHKTAVMSLDRAMLQRLEDGEDTAADRAALDRFTAEMANALQQLTVVKLH
ncbi:MAG: hypothetical protein AAF530_12845 [Pseudomonadota bacterium]